MLLGKHNATYSVLIVMYYFVDMHLLAGVWLAKYFVI